MTLKNLLNNYSAFFSILQSSPLSNRKLLIVKGLFQERTQKAQTRRERERECGGGGEKWRGAFVHGITTGVLPMKPTAALVTLVGMLNKIVTAVQ